MRIAYNPKTSAALTAAPSNNDITFDLSGMAIYARGVKFDGKAYNVFKKHASGNTGGYDGLVPVPSYNNNSKNRFLKEDGTWDTTNTLTWKDDVRTTSTKPADYLNSFTFIGIKNSSAIGSPTTDTFVNLIGWKGYLDNTGPLACELASGLNRISVRFGAYEEWGNWNTLAYLSDINIMTGATSSKDGKEGLVPKPLKADYNKVLRADGTWISLPNCIEIIQSTESFSTIHKSSIVYGYLENELEKVKGDYGIFSFLTTPYTSEDHYYFRQLKGSVYSDRIQTRVYYKTKNATDPTYTEWETIAYTSDLTWDNIINKPTSFTPSAHEHPTNQINALTGYSKAKAAADLATTDTLNVALGKLEYKADIAYLLVKGAYDGDGTIENLTEILKVLEGISDTTTIKTILNNYVTTNTNQTITGIKKFTNETQFYNDTIGIRLVNTNTVAYLLFGQHTGDNKVHKGIISGISGAALNLLTIQATETSFSGQITATKFIGTLNNTLIFLGGTFGSKSYNNSSAITVNIPTKTSHLTNDSNFITSRGYIGTTSVLSSEAAQSLSGIIDIIATGNYTSAVSTSTSLYLKLANKDTAIGLRADSGTIRGVYDYGKSKWLVYSNGTDGSVLLGHTSTSSTWSKPTGGAGAGIKILNAVNSSPTEALASYSIGLEVSGYYSLLLASKAGVNDTLYFKGALSTGWIGILHAGNSSISGGGSTWGSSITVKINGESKTLTIPSNPNTWRPITDAYDVTSPSSTTSLSQTGAESLLRNVKSFKRFLGTAINEGYDLNTLTEGMVYNYGSTDYWKNGPSGMLYGRVLNLKDGTGGSIAGLLAWDINHGSTTDTTRYLWWRVSDDGTFTEAKWHRLAYVDDIPSIPSVSITDSGSGNAVTSITASGHTLTVTKGSTFSLSGHSHSTLTFLAGTFSAQTYNGTAAKTVNIPTSKSHVGLGNVQNTAFYKRVTTVNGEGWNLAGTTNGDAFTIYAPTTSGSGGDLLISDGEESAPVWTSPGNVTVGGANKADKLGTVDKGSTTKPIYLKAGAPTECSTYAGGTSVTLNGASKSASTASFYASTSAGTEGQVLISNGSGNSPTWTYLEYSTLRNFTNGTLIKTDIDYSAQSGDPFYGEIKGNTYGDKYTCNTLFQGYIYDNTIINYGVSHLTSVKITPITAMNVGGKLCFWFPRLAYWHGYSIKVTTGYNYSINRVTEVVDSADPGGTKRVVLTEFTKDPFEAIKSITRSGTTFTYTRLDGTTGTFTQLDNTGVTSIATGTGLTGGTITTTGTISINSTYLTYISNGNTAYGWGNHANAGYIKSRGYIGTTAVSSSLNAGQNITGIGNITPNATKNYSLGSSVLRWNSAYINSFNIHGSDTSRVIEDLGTTGLLYINTSAINGLAILHKASNSTYGIVLASNLFRPLSTGLISLGNSSYRWNNIYANHLNAEGGSFYTNANGAYWTSDVRLKTNITKARNLDIADLLVEFDWKESNEHSWGYIAQDLLEVLPEAVSYNADTDRYAVNYNVAHSAAIASLTARIKELEEKLKKYGLG